MQNDISKKLAVKRALRVNDFCDAYGVCRATAYKMLESLATQIEDGGPPNLADSEPYPLLGIPCHFLEVNPRYYSDYVGFALWFYRKRRFSSLPNRLVQPRGSVPVR